MHDLPAASPAPSRARRRLLCQNLKCWGIKAASILFSTSYTARLNGQLQLLFCLLLEICVATPLAASIEPWQLKHVLVLAMHAILQLDNRLTT